MIRLLMIRFVALSNPLSQYLLFTVISNILFGLYVAHVLYTPVTRSSGTELSPDPHWSSGERSASNRATRWVNLQVQTPFSTGLSAPQMSLVSIKSCYFSRPCVIFCWLDRGWAGILFPGHTLPKSTLYHADDRLFIRRLLGTSFGWRHLLRIPYRVALRSCCVILPFSLFTSRGVDIVGRESSPSLVYEVTMFLESSPACVPLGGLRMWQQPKVLVEGHQFRVTYMMRGSSNLHINSSGGNDKIQCST